MGDVTVIRISNTGLEVLAQAANSELRNRSRRGDGGGSEKTNVCVQYSAVPNSVAYAQWSSEKNKTKT